MRVYTPEECRRKADYYHQLWLRAKNPKLAEMYSERADMWYAREMSGGFCAHE